MDNSIKINGGNIKLGCMGSFSKLYGDASYTINNMTCTGTCGHHCNGCKNACYVKASYRYPSVILRHMINTLAMRESVENSLATLDAQLTRKRTPFKTVRINQSGELESLEEFLMWIELANRHNETTFYVYTKAIDLIGDYILENGLPTNLVVLVSIWGEYGMADYNRLCHIGNIKAFVCVTANYTAQWYDEHGLAIQTYCKAYDEQGHLDHNITCDKCQKCFNHLSSCKVIGCFEH